MDKFVSLFTTLWGNVVRWWNGLVDNRDNVILGLIVLILLLVLAKPLAEWISRLLAKGGRKWPHIEQGVYTSLREPLRYFFYLTAVWALFKIAGTSANFESFLDKTYRIGNIILITWILMNFTPTLTKMSIRLNEKNDSSNEVAIRFVANILKVLIVTLSVSVIISELGYNVNGIITGLGLGGLTLSLAAKNTATNLFSGFEIVTDRPFDVGDYIRTPSVEGKIEDITMRSTRIRTADDLLIIVPNSNLMQEPITNVSAMGKRFIKTTIGLEYTTPNRVLRRIMKQIEDMLKENKSVDPGRITVNFKGFGDNSLDIQLLYFTVETDIDDHESVNTDINFKIREIVEQNGASFAFPSRTIYFDNGETPVYPSEAEETAPNSADPAPEGDLPEDNVETH